MGSCITKVKKIWLSVTRTLLNESNCLVCEGVRGIEVGGEFLDALQVMGKVSGAAPFVFGVGS